MKQLIDELLVQAIRVYLNLFVTGVTGARSFHMTGGDRCTELSCSKKNCWRVSAFYTVVVAEVRYLTLKIKLFSYILKQKVRK